MPIDFVEIFGALAMPFDKDEVKQRTQAGVQLSYVTARTVANRLDEVLGPAGWWDHYIPIDHGAICQLSIRLPDGSVLTKEDAGGDATMNDAGDNEKAGISDAFKRAANKFGIGRYLYRDGVPEFARSGFVGEDEVLAYAQTRQTSSSQPARSSAPAAASAAPAGRPAAPSGDGQSYGPPRSGKGLFAWCMEADKANKYAPYKALDTCNSIGKDRNFAPRMVDWTAEQVAEVHRDAEMALTNADPHSHRAAY